MNDKAQRIIRDGRVEQSEGTIWGVAGDTGIYIVTILDDGHHAPWGVCTCQYGSNIGLVMISTGNEGCSHLQAAYGKMTNGS